MAGSLGDALTEVAHTMELNSLRERALERTVRAQIAEELVESGRLAMESLLTSLMDTGDHGGEANDLNCEICQRIAAGQDWLRAIHASRAKERG